MPVRAIFNVVVIFFSVNPVVVCATSGTSFAGFNRSHNVVNHIGEFKRSLPRHVG